ARRRARVARDLDSPARRTGEARMRPRGIDRRPWAPSLRSPPAIATTPSCGGRSRLAGHDADVCAELLGDGRDEPKLRVASCREEAADARRVAADVPCELGLREPGPLAQLVELADDRVHLSDLAAGALVLLSEPGVLHARGEHPLVVARVRPLRHQTSSTYPSWRKRHGVGVA